MQNNICKVSCKYKNKTHTYSVQFRPSVVSDSLRPHVLQHTRPPRPVTNSRSPPKPMSVESVMPSSHLILCCPLLLLPSTFPSIRVFSNASALLIRWPKCWSFSFNISPSNEHSDVAPFRSKITHCWYDPDKCTDVDILLVIMLMQGKLKFWS